MLMRILIIVAILYSEIVLSCEIKMRAFSLPPLAIKQNGKWSGLDIDYGQLLADELRCKLVFVEVPWARGLRLLESGDIDFMVNVTKTEVRKEQYYFIGPQRIETIRLVSKKDHFPLVKSWDQFDQLSISMMRQRGSFLGNRLDLAIKRNTKLKQKLVELPNNDIRIDILLKDRVEAFLVDELFISHLGEDIKNQLDVHPLVINQSPVYYAFSKRNTDSHKLKTIEYAFTNLIKSEKFKIITQKYQALSNAVN